MASYTETPSQKHNLWRRICQFFNIGKLDEPNLRESMDELLDELDDDVVMAPEGRVLIENILRTGDKTAYDVMIPRADIIAIPLNMKHDEMVQVMLDHPHSRYPVYKDDLDEVEGMIHVKDVFATTIKKENKRGAMRRMLRQVLFIAPKMPILDLLIEMRQEKKHMALVVDEYGGIDGLITIEDLIEEIVGDIEDEYDHNTQHDIKAEADGTYRVSARIPLGELEEIIGSFLQKEELEADIDTLGGLIFNLCARVPSRGEVIIHEASGVQFTVLSTDTRRIRTVQITLPNTGSNAS